MPEPGFWGMLWFFLRVAAVSFVVVFVVAAVVPLMGRVIERLWR